MPHARYYTPHPLRHGDFVTLTPEEEKHLLKVMRTQIGDLVELVDGKGSLAKAVLISSHKLKIEEIYFEKPLETQLIVAQALPKASRLDFIVEKGTELGMSELWLFPGERSEKKEVSETLLHRLESIVISSLKQCGRLYLPKILIKPSLKLWKAPLQYPSFFGDVDPTAPPLLKAWDKDSLIFFIGPESGFSHNEDKLLKEFHSKGVKLHNQILRTDTASLCFLSIANHALL